MTSVNEIMTEIISRDRLKPQRMMKELGVKRIHVEGTLKNNSLGLHQMNGGDYNGTRRKRYTRTKRNWKFY